MLRFKELNANPYHKDINDCVIRALSLALNMDYEHLCNVLGLKFIPGIGLKSQKGLTFDWIVDKRLKKYFSVYEFDSFYAVPDEYIDDDLNDTLETWYELYEGTGQAVVNLRPGKSDKSDSWHLTYIDTNRGVFYDTFDCRDMKVYGFAFVKPEMKLPNSDPNSRFQWYVRKFGPKKLEKYKNKRL